MKQKLRKFAHPKVVIGENSDLVKKKDFKMEQFSKTDWENGKSVRTNLHWETEKYILVLKDP